MSGDATGLTQESVRDGVRTVVAEVLFVSEDDVRPASSLVRDLGAESIDFLDLVFRLEDVLGRRVPVAHFDAWLRARYEGGGPADITVEIVTEFALEEAGLAGA